jgi:hypothetical protein
MLTAYPDPEDVLLDNKVYKKKMERDSLQHILDARDAVNPEKTRVELAQANRDLATARRQRTARKQRGQHDEMPNAQNGPPENKGLLPPTDHSNYSNGNEHGVLDIGHDERHGRFPHLEWPRIFRRKQHED